MGSLQILSLPDQAVNKMQVLVFNVRTLCADTLFHRAARGAGQYSSSVCSVDHYRYMYYWQKKHS